MSEDADIDQLELHGFVLGEIQQGVLDRVDDAFGEVANLIRADNMRAGMCEICFQWLIKWQVVDTRHPQAVSSRGDPGGECAGDG